MKRPLDKFADSQMLRLRNSVTTAFTMALWRTLHSIPALRLLPLAEFANIERETGSMVNRKLVGAHHPKHEKQATEFSFRNGFDAFQVDLAGAVVCRLEAFLQTVNNLDLITRLLPQAISGAVVGVVPCTIPTRPGTYRMHEARVPPRALGPVSASGWSALN